MHTVRHYINVRRETIAKYVVGRTILAECQGQTKSTVRCPGGGGGSRRCAWMMFDLFGSRDWATLLSTEAEWTHGNALLGRGRCNWIERFEVLVTVWTDLLGREHWWVGKRILCYP